MGADMLIYVVPVPRYAEGARQLHDAMIGKDSIRASDPEQAFERDRIRLRHVFSTRLDAALSTLDEGDIGELFDQYVEWFDGPVPDDARATLRQEVMVAMEAVYFKASREVALVTLDGRDWLFTGGLSHGDHPTDIASSFYLLEELGQFFDPITHEELAAAAQHLAQTEKEAPRGS